MVIKSNDSIIIEEQAFPADDSYGIAAGSHELDFVPGPDLQSGQAEVRSEEVIRAAELSYRRLFETARDGILILDADTGRITDVNPFLIKLLGFSHDEIIGRTVGELSPIKDAGSHEMMFDRLQKVGYVRHEDLPLETRDGRHIAVEFVSNVYQAGAKKVIQCNVRDITERKRTEEQLRASLEKIGNLNSALGEHMASVRLAAIVESSEDAIIGIDLHGIVTSWNGGGGKDFRLRRQGDDWGLNYEADSDREAGRGKSDSEEGPLWGAGQKL